MTRHTKEHEQARCAMSKAGQILPVMMLSFLLVACGGDNFDDLRTYIDQVKARNKGRVEPLPIANQHEIFRYQADALRDPLQPVFYAPVKTQETGRRLEPLENYPLDSLKMLGSMFKSGQIQAVIKAGDGAIYTVKVGNFIGQNHGKIVQITDGKIELRELISDGLGGWEQRTTSLALNN